MSMSTTTAEAKKVLPEENPADDVLFNSIFGVRTIELNRPSKLNALNKSMAEKIVPRLQVRLLPHRHRHGRGRGRSSCTTSLTPQRPHQ
jgi:predicted metal-dependent RNase